MKYKAAKSTIDSDIIVLHEVEDGLIVARCIGFWASGIYLCCCATAIDVMYFKAPDWLINGWLELPLNVIIDAIAEHCDLPEFLQEALSNCVVMC